MATKHTTITTISALLLAAVPLAACPLDDTVGGDGGETGTADEVGTDSDSSSDDTTDADTSSSSDDTTDETDETDDAESSDESSSEDGTDSSSEDGTDSSSEDGTDSSSEDGVDETETEDTDDDIGEDPFCGDGIVDGVEDCDDGNDDDLDGCLDNCTIPPVLSAGAYHTCALAHDGHATCWGRGDEGQTDVPPGLYLEIDAGYMHTCAITDAFEVACWGRDIDGESSSPAGEFFTVAAGGYNEDGVGGWSCALDLGGAIDCWGAPPFGVGEGALFPPQGTWTALDIEGVHGVVLDVASVPHTWGTTVDELPGVPLGGFDLGSDMSCAVEGQGDAECFGLDDGRLGPIPDVEIHQISAGRFHGCALGTDGFASCWGNSAWSGAQPIETISFVSIAAGGGEGPDLDHACGVVNDGTIECWGDNDDLQLEVLAP